MRRVFMKSLLILILLAFGALNDPVHFAGWAQSEKAAQKADHNPKIDSALERILKLGATGNASAAGQLAAQANIPYAGNSITVIFDLNVIPDDPPQVFKRVLDLIRQLTGGNIQRTARNLVKAQVPLNPEGVKKVAALAEVNFIRPPLLPLTLVTSEGVSLTGASSYHANGIRGAGVKIAIIDLGFIGIASAQARGELPGNIQTIDYTGSGMESVTPHGTAVAEIVNDMAPDAQLILMKVSDEVDLENAKDDAVRMGVKVINHSVGWFNTSFYDGTGKIVEIANDARAKGIVWVNAAGNYGQRHWQGTYRPNAQGYNQFAGTDDTLSFQANGGDFVTVFLTWNDWPASRNDFDLFLLDNNGNQLTSSERIQSGTETPTETFSFRVPSTGIYHLRIRGDNNPSPRTFSLFNLNQDIEYPIVQASLISPADSPNVITVGAVGKDRWTTGPIQPYSSQGPSNAGVSKPDITGPDCVSTVTFAGAASAAFCGANGLFPGTSAAAPHIAGAAALLLAANPGFTASQVEQKLKNDAIPMGSPNQFGAGRVNLSAVVPVQRPDLSFANVTFTPSSPRIGDLVTINFQVRNTGAGNAGAFSVEIRDSGGSDRRFVNSLNAGGSVSLSFQRQVRQNPEDFTLIADVDNQLDDANRSNNTFTLRVTPQAASKPDLIPINPDFSPRNPNVGDTVNVTVTVQNVGTGDAGSFLVEIRDSAGTDRRTITSLTASRTTSVSFSRRINVNPEIFTITVDSTNQVDESNESNNTITLRVDAIQPVAKPDLTIERLDAVPSAPRVGDNVNLNVSVRNIGSVSAGPFVVQISDSGGTDRQSFSGLSANGSLSLTFTRRMNSNSELFTVTVDAFNQVDESNENNNTSQIRVNAQQPVQRPDLVIDRMMPSPTTPRVGDNVTINVVVRNQGSGNAGFFVVEVRDSGGQQRLNVSSLNAGSSVSLNFARRMNSNSEVFTAMADVLNQVDESDETNNTFSIRVDALQNIGKPDLIIDDLMASPANPTLGQNVTLTALIRNGGTADANPFFVDIRDSVGSDRRSVSAGLRVGGTVTISFTRRISVSTETYTAVADSTNVLDELDKSNNSRSIRVTAQSGGPSLAVDIHTNKSSYQIGENLQIQLTLSARAYTYIFDIDATGKVSLVFPNSVSANNLIGPGNYNIPDANYTLGVVGPAGTEYVHALVVSQPVDLGLDNQSNSAWLNPSTFQAELANRIQSRAPSAGYARNFASFQVTSASSGQNQPPIGCFTVTPQSPEVFQPVTFDASCSRDPDGQIVKYEWDYDNDGQINARGVKVTILFFQEAKTYPITLILTDDKGAVTRYTQPLTIRAKGQQPPASSNLPQLPNVAGIYVVGTDKLYVIVQGSTSWLNDRPYKIELETDGSFTSLDQTLSGPAAPQGIAPVPAGLQKISVAGSVRSGRVDYAFGLAPGTKTMKFTLQIDLDGDGALDSQTNVAFIYLNGQLLNPLSNPFILTTPAANLLPFAAAIPLNICTPNPNQGGLSTTVCFRLQ
ncbi:S8 family serine peptidase [Candidatus Acetothermia bacterium]|nr:S8 family serine peptidase [Candidatus Acetothermia bacterium]